MMRARVDPAAIGLRGAGLDESPGCYKHLDDVLEAVGDTMHILAPAHLGGGCHGRKERVRSVPGLNY